MELSGSARDYRLLLGSLCLLGLIYPILDPEWLGYSGLVCWTGVFWVVLFLSIRALREGRLAKRIDVILFVLAIALGAVALIFGFDHDPASRIHRTLSVSADVVSLALLLHVTFVILRSVLAKGRVDANRIWGSVCVYILIGLIWAYVFGLLAAVFENCLVPSHGFGGSQSPPSDAVMHSLSTRLYFSFVTLTTVGYGDIAPGNVVMRLLATVEGVVGQLYLTILVARLVGLHITHSRIGLDEQADD